MANNTCEKPPASYRGDGTTIKYTFAFPYVKASDVHVSVNDIDKVYPTEYFFANATEIQFVTPPSVNSRIKIYRTTDVCSTVAEFYPGSTIRAQDLNNNFEQTLFAVQEATDLIANSDAATVKAIAEEALETADDADEKADLALSLVTSEGINVKSFGAKGDGVTDDYTSITAAITAAAGKVLIFPAGVYRTSQQIFFKESNSIIRGEGDVTIKNMDGIDQSVGCAAIGNPYTANEAYNGDWKNYPPTTNVIVENLKFDYNRERWFNDIGTPDLADRWNACGLAIANAQYVTVRNCRVTDGKRQCIDITCPTGKYDYPDDSDDDRPGTLIEMINMPSQPADVNGDSIFSAQFITIDNCIAEGAGDDVIATHWCSNVLIKNSLFQMTSGKGQSSNTNCIEIDDGSRNITVDNCTAFNGMGGIEVKGHPPQPSPYNIIISNTRIINCAAPFENHHTDWEERVDGKASNAWNQLLNTWVDVDGSSTQTVFSWTFPNDDISSASDIEVSFDYTNGTEVEQTTGFTVDFAAKTVTFSSAPTSTRVRIRRKFFKLSPDTAFECFTYNGESPLARGLTYSNIQIIAPQQRYSISSTGKKNYLGTSRAFEIGAYNEVNLQNFYISDGADDSGAGIDGYRPTQGHVSLRASDNSIYCKNHGYRIGEPVRFNLIQPSDGSTGLVDTANVYWVQEITGKNRFKVTTEWEKVTDTQPEYDPTNATVVPINADGSAMLNVLNNGMFHIRDGTKGLSIDGVSINGFGRIETSGGKPADTYDSERVVAQQAINIVSSTRGALFVNNYRSNDGPIKVVDGSGSWQYTGHISNVYAYQSNGGAIDVQPITSASKNLTFSSITIAGYPEGRKWAVNGPVTDVIDARPPSSFNKSTGAGSMLTNKTTGQLLTKVSDYNDSIFLNLTACAWVHFSGSATAGTDINLKRQNNVKQVDKTASGDYTVHLADYLKFSSNNDVLVFVMAGTVLGSQAYAEVPVIASDGTCSFRVTTFNGSDVAYNPASIRILVYGRPL